MTFSWGRRLAASLVSALAVAILAHLVTVFIYFVAQGFQPAALVAASDYFALPSVVALVLVFLAGLAGAFRSRPVALASGVIGGALAALLGSLLVVVLAGAAFTAELWGQLLGILAGVALPFWLAVGVIAMSLGVMVYRAVFEYRTVLTDVPVAFVRIPSTEFAGDSGDAVLVDEQWDSFVAALSAAGYRTHEVPERQSAREGVFVGDAAVLFGDIAFLSTLPTDRAAELEDIDATLRAEGYAVERVQAPGELDAADVLRVGTTLFAAPSAGTNPEGIRQLRAFASEYGAAVVGVPPVPGGRRLREAFSALPDGTVLGFGENAEHAALFGRYLTVPESAGAHTLALTVDRVLVPASAPQTAALLESFGYRVTEVDLGAFESRGGSTARLGLLN